MRRLAAGNICHQLLPKAFPWSRTFNKTHFVQSKSLHDLLIHFFKNSKVIQKMFYDVIFAHSIQIQKRFLSQTPFSLSNELNSL